MAEPWQTLKRIVAEAMAAARSDKGDPQPDWPDFAPDYDRVFASLTRQELYGDAQASLEDELFAGVLGPARPSDHFLDFYSAEGAQLAFERYGFFGLLRERGFDPVVGWDLGDPDEHKLRVYDGEVAPERLLIEAGMGIRDRTFPDRRTCRLLFVNWLLMQDPYAEFSDDRPKLPGQERPGLGLFPHFAYLLRLVALRLGCGGMLDRPSHFHNAALYGRLSRFVDPAVEGRFRALERDLASLPLAEASVAVDQGRVRDAKGKPLVWQAHDQVAPITGRVRAWFGSDAYRSAARRAREEARFMLA